MIRSCVCGQRVASMSGARFAPSSYALTRSYHLHTCLGSPMLVRQPSAGRPFAWAVRAVSSGTPLQKEQRQPAGGSQQPAHRGSEHAEKGTSDQSEADTQSALPGVIPLPLFMLATLRGMGQVFFCNSTLTGGLSLLGIAIANPPVACSAVLGCASANAMAHAQARLLNSSTKDINAGFVGYNGALIGCAFAMLLGKDPLTTALATAFAGAVSAMLVGPLRAIIVPVPQWTWIFNMLAISVVALVRPRRDDPRQYETLSCRALDPVDWLVSVLNGISQVFFVNNPYAGFLMLVGIFSCNQVGAAAAFLGSLLGALTGAYLGADAAEVNFGLWGVNPALTALSVSAVFVPSGAAFWALACGGAVAAALARLGVKEIVNQGAGAPSLTLPFCLVATGCFLLGGRMPGVHLAK